jgi:hypothetical protein
MKAKMVIDPVLLLVAGSAAAIAIVVFAAYKSTQSSAESIASTSVSGSSSIEETSPQPISLSAESSEPTNDFRAEDSYSSTTPAASNENPVDIPSFVSPSPEIPTASFAEPIPVAAATIAENPAQTQPIEELSSPIETETFVQPATTPIQEAPTPFPEETFSASSPQTPAPTDVSAVENIAAPNSSSAATPGPVLVIATPKRRQPRTRKIASSTNGMPRRKRNNRAKATDRQPFNMAGTSTTPAPSDSQSEQ